MNPELDAQQLAQCIFIGNYRMFWMIIDEYLGDNTSVDDPRAQLILQLADTINCLQRREPEEPEPQPDSPASTADEQGHHTQTTPTDPTGDNHGMG